MRATINQLSAFGIQDVTITLDVSSLPFTPRYNGPMWGSHPDQLTIQPSEAKVTFFEDESVSAHIRGFAVKADGSRDRRFNTTHLIIGARELEADVIRRARALLRDFAKGMVKS